MPVVPACLPEPLWGRSSALLPERPAASPGHPLGCHRRRIPDRVISEHAVAALVHGSGCERVATSGRSDRTIRRRLRDWAAAGLAEQVHALALRAYDRRIGLGLDEPAADGCITEAPGGGEVAGRSPFDRGKQGLKRSAVTDGRGIPPHLVDAATALRATFTPEQRTLWRAYVGPQDEPFGAGDHLRHALSCRAT